MHSDSLAISLHPLATVISMLLLLNEATGGQTRTDRPRPVHTPVTKVSLQDEEEEKEEEEEYKGPQPFSLSLSLSLSYKFPDPGRQQKCPKSIY